jgi:hypothetical protein
MRCHFLCKSILLSLDHGLNPLVERFGSVVLGISFYPTSNFKATSKCSSGERLKPERAKRCKFPKAKATMAAARAFASTVGVGE